MRKIVQLGVCCLESLDIPIGFPSRPRSGMIQGNLVVQGDCLTNISTLQGRRVLQQVVRRVFICGYVHLRESFDNVNNPLDAACRN
jgi:hypothetical protein